MTQHPDISEPDSVTHFLCPDGPTENGEPVATHHLVPKRAGKVGGEPAYQHVCRYCGQTEKQLRERLL